MSLNEMKEEELYKLHTKLMMQFEGLQEQIKGVHQNIISVRQELLKREKKPIKVKTEINKMEEK